MPASSNTPLSVLVVDDNLAAAELLGDVLRTLGHRASVAGGGEQAIRVAVVSRPDAILMDLRMPDIDGWEAARRIKTVMPEIALIAMSGAISSADWAKARVAGCEAQITKPVTRSGLAEVLGTVCADRT